VTAAEQIAAVAQALTLPGKASSDFDLNAGVALAPRRKLRAAAVLVPLVMLSGEVRIILTKRASGLKHHPGQIAFPGGKVEREDLGPAAAALREAREEIALAPANVEILGQLPAHETVTGFRVTPVVGRVRAPFIPRHEASEVAEVFTVPLAHVIDLSSFRVESRFWRGERRYYYTVPWGPYYIWGATARVLRGLAERLAK